MKRKFQSKTGINVYYKYRTKDRKHLPIILDARLRALFSQEASITNIQEHVKLYIIVTKAKWNNRGHLSHKQRLDLSTPLLQDVLATQ